MNTAVGRPVTTSIIAVVLFIQSIIAIAIGVGLIVERNNTSLMEHIDQETGVITGYGIAALIWGGITLLVAMGLWHGANWARILVGIVEVVHIAGGVWLLFGWDGHYLWQGVWQILIALVVLWMLFNPRADAFFSGRRA